MLIQFAYSRIDVLVLIGIFCDVDFVCVCWLIYYPLGWFVAFVFGSGLLVTTVNSCGVYLFWGLVCLIGFPGHGVSWLWCLVCLRDLLD